jgi:hypothetical protein
MTVDVFHTMAGKHGIQGTWGVYRLDMRGFDSAADGEGVKVQKIAEVSEAQWLNGAIFLPTYNLLLMAEFLQGKLIASHIPTGSISVWLQHEL